jgi:hypothetical protein
MVISSYLLPRILGEIGIKDNRTKNLINLALTCWGLVNATALALTVSKFKRRHAYLVGTPTPADSRYVLICADQLCTTSLLLIFTGWTVASARYVQTGSDGAWKAALVYSLLHGKSSSLR